MTKRTWQSADDLVAGTSPIAQRDEFGPEVAQAIADLRAQHGIASVSCQPEGNTPGGLDRLRSELRDMLPGVNRRGFLRLTGAAAVFALAGCNEKHPDTLVPYASAPEGHILGEGTWFSTVVRDAGYPVAVMAKTYEGRPIKLEGNPDCPVGRGRADARTQAALVNLYDPDRLQSGPVKVVDGKTEAISWDDLDTAIGTAVKQGGIGLVTGPVDGPASRQLIVDFTAAFGGKVRHAVYRPVSQAVAAEARSLALGDASGAPTYQVGKAAVLVTLGSDLLGEGTLAEHIGFGELRALKGEGAAAWMGQVIAFEPTLSQTGACADLRVRVSADRLAHLGWALAQAVAAKLGVAAPAGISPVADLGLKSLTIAGKPVDPLAYVAEQLIAAKQAGRNSLVYVGGAAQAATASLPLHLAAAYLNAILGNEGVTVGRAPVSALPVGDIAALAQACVRGEIQTLIISGANPVYSWPAFADALAKVKTVVVLADRLDETAAKAHFLAPTLHALESWGDAEVAPGVVALQQPVIQRLWNARAAEESLLAFAVAGGVAPAAFTQPKVQVKDVPAVITRVPVWQAAAHGVQSWQGYVKAVWLAQVKPAAQVLSGDTAFWNSALATGVVTLGVPAAKSALDLGAIAKAVTLAAPSSAGLQLVLSASRTIGDGTWLNNAWLNELPDPVSKITWDNYLAVSPKDAADQGWKDGDVLAVTANGTTLNLPVHIQDGQHPGTLETFLGWGRERAGAVAKLCVDDGFSVNAYRFVNSHLVGSAGITATVAKTSATYLLANVQGHHRLEGRTEIARDRIFGATEEAGEHAGWEKGTDGKPAGRLSLWGSSHAYPGHRWGMTVDMNSCTGCNACITACSAENNVPVVGRDEVRKNREMHWIRIDRYYTGDEKTRLDVEAINQPVMCQQCENAPCEVVCPANATMHNEQGQNLMVYNRCIGTRYCANNCPYKVRRFNWYEYSQLRAGPHGAGNQLERVVKNVVTTGSVTSRDELTHAPLQMLLNPDVTVRSKGVMEKCNLCVQRTRTIRDQEKRTNRKYQDGSITTACAQTCPTKAITFGDLNDPFSGAVTTAKLAEKRGYLLLDEELNTRPGIIYLARLRNRPAEEAPASSAHPAEGAHS
jgi:molybdopterin-containing oxidoreductase family iron-sulfur binding subunit